MNLIKDALYYTRADSGASVEKAQGVVIGVVSTLMALKRVDFATAIAQVKALLPHTYRIDAIPEAWRDALKGEG